MSRWACGRRPRKRCQSRWISYHLSLGLSTNGCVYYYHFIHFSVGPPQYVGYGFPVGFLLKASKKGVPSLSSQRGQGTNMANVFGPCCPSLQGSKVMNIANSDCRKMLPVVRNV